MSTDCVPSMFPREETSWNGAMDDLREARPPQETPNRPRIQRANGGIEEVVVEPPRNGEASPPELEHPRHDLVDERCEEQAKSRGCVRATRRWVRKSGKGIRAIRRDGEHSAGRQDAETLAQDPHRILHVQKDFEQENGV